MPGKFGGATLDERLQAREWLYWDFDRLAAPLYRARVIKLGIRKAAPEVFEDCIGSAQGGLPSSRRIWPAARGWWARA